MSAGVSSTRAKDYLQRVISHQSSDTSASSSDSCRSRPACLSELDIYDNRHHSHYKKKSSPQHRRSPSRSGSEAPRSRHHSDRKSVDRQRMRQGRDRPQPSRCIGVFGLAIHTTQQQVRELFNKFGKIERIQMVIDAHTRRSRGFCFIYFENLNDARTAKDACTGMDVDGRRIRVDYSITQRAHTPTPGVYMGQPSRSARIRSREEGSRDGSRSRRRYREASSSVSPYDSHSRRYRSRHRYERSRTRSRSRSRSYSRSPRKSRVTPRY
ncbi:transformer-2 sex-determining protein isoform X1 [Drosophila nasuta]|uniref:transformer-2 sex-determining protein isoform X1 n=1 Tax=Drosophila nasuta TaxID=42062 RepID=UPI00295EC222|nr:transformer-2 sex-determining protein isoform X1 [Drosophila nasuta]